jgi:hypothetical protein
MHRYRVLICSALAAATAGPLAGCDDHGNDNGNEIPARSYVGTTDSFVAWANGDTGVASAAPTGSYAGKRQVLRGTIDPVTGAQLGELAGVEIYKGADGHIYALDMTSSSTPVPQQVSSESAATVDDTCSLNGTQVTGANSDYLGVDFVADLTNPTNSRYFYRLPGPGGVCDTADDVIRMVMASTPPNVAATTVPAMPTAVVHDGSGAITGFVAKSAASLLLYDASFADPVTLGSFAAPIGVATVLPLGTTQGYPTGQLYVVDGNIVYVNYAAPSVSGPLFTIPGWTPTATHAIFAASPTTLYFAINTAAAGSTPASATLYAMPADGSAPPAALVTEPGFVAQMQFPVLSTDLIFSTVANATYSVFALAQGATTPLTLAIVAQNAGTFTATATSVYWTTWTQTVSSASLTYTRTGTQSGIVGVNGGVIEAPVANSMFASGGEYLPWPLTNGTSPATTQTALQTVFQVQNLSPVTVFGPATGYTYTIDGVAGGTLIAIDTGSNQVVNPDVGTVPQGTATFLTVTFRSDEHSGFIDASTFVSTQDPATRDLYLINSYSTNTLEAITGNL